MTPQKKIDFFTSGGTLSLESPSYIKREADEDLFRYLLKGDLCYILTSRQMGKSSLMIRTAARLQEKGCKTAIIDLTQIGTVDAEKWYLGLLNQLRKRLGIKTTPASWWNRHPSLSPTQKFAGFISEVILDEIKKQIIIFVDEIDSTLNYEFRDDFFALVRSLHNERAENPELRRLTFALIGVATPTDLISDSAKTPFNIGHAIELRPFNNKEMSLFERGLKKSYPKLKESIIQRIYYWTNGHPYITQRICHYLEEARIARLDENEIDKVVEMLFLSEESRRETNLQFIQNTILNHPSKKYLLHLYNMVIHKKAIRDNKKSVECNYLKLSGLVISKNGNLEIGNLIYERVFNRDWVRKNTDSNWGKIASAFSMATTVLFVSLFLYNYLVDNKAIKTINCYYNPNPKQIETRTACLATLFELKPLFNTNEYDDQARDLFWNLHSWEEQEAIIQSSKNNNQIVPITRGLYTALADPDNNDGTSKLLLELSKTLATSKQTIDVIKLKTELNHWIKAREYSIRGEYSLALKEYDLALLENKNNLAVSHEKAVTLIRLKKFKEALTELEKIAATTTRTGLTLGAWATPTSIPPLIDTFSNGSNTNFTPPVRPTLSNSTDLVGSINTLILTHTELFNILLDSSSNEYINLKGESFISPQLIANSQCLASSYYPETGHSIETEFLNTFCKASDPILVYGYPITQKFISKDGNTVQYFQRARLELSKDKQIVVTPIGKKLYTPGEAINVFNPFACRVFPKTGFSVCYAFLDFFDSHGGVAQFGNPISSFENRNDLIVQYFENARFEWKPWLPEGQRVTIADLGRPYFDSLEERKELLTPLAPSNQSSGVKSIDVRAFVWKAVTLATDNQLIYVIVQDQNLLPVPNASGVAIVHFPSGADTQIRFFTNTSGVGIIPFSFTNQKYGELINVDITVVVDEIASSTKTTFRIWY